MHTQAEFIDLRMRAEFHELCGEQDMAEELRQRSIEVAREVDINCYAYQLLWRGRADQAVELLQMNVASHPNSWNAWDSLGEVYATIGQVERAIEYYAHALTLVDTPEAARRIRSSLAELNARRAAAEMAS